MCAAVLPKYLSLTALTQYLPDFIANWKDIPHVQPMLAHYPETMGNTAGGFHLYQVRIILKNWGYCHDDPESRHVAGPGRLPMC